MYSNAAAAVYLGWECGSPERSEFTQPRFFAGFASGNNCRHLMNPNPETVSEFYVE